MTLLLTDMRYSAVRNDDKALVVNSNTSLLFSTSVFAHGEERGRSALKREEEKIEDR